MGPLAVARGVIVRMLSQILGREVKPARGASRLSKSRTFSFSLGMQTEGATETRAVLLTLLCTQGHLAAARPPLAAWSFRSMSHGHGHSHGGDHDGPTVPITFIYEKVWLPSSWNRPSSRNHSCGYVRS